MDPVTFVDAVTLQNLISKIDLLSRQVNQIAKELKAAKKPYLTSAELMELTGFKKDWINDNKQDIGYSMVGGRLRFKREDVEEYMHRNYFKAKRK